jgi:hypothetical protein
MGFGNTLKKGVGVVKTGAKVVYPVTNLTSGGRSRGGGGFGADFTGEDMRRQQDFNINVLNNAYQRALGQMSSVSGPGRDAYQGLSSQYAANLQSGINQSGLQSLYGPEYLQNLQQIALTQGTQGSLSAARLASQAGRGRGGMAFGGGAAEQLRRAQGEASLGTQQNLLGAQAGAEQGKAQVGTTLANLLSAGAGQQAQIGLQGLQGEQQLALSEQGGIGQLAQTLLTALAKISPDDTNKTYDNTLKALQALIGGGGGSSGQGGGAVGSTLGSLGALGVI